MVLNPTPEKVAREQSHQITPHSIYLLKISGSTYGIKKKFTFSAVNDTKLSSAPIAIISDGSVFCFELPLLLDYKLNLSQIQNIKRRRLWTDANGLFLRSFSG